MSVTLTTECVWRSSVYDRFSKKCNLLILRNIALLLVTLSDSVAEYTQYQKHRHIYLNMGPSCFEKESRVLYFYTNIHYESRSQECPLAYFQSWVAFCFGCFFFLFLFFKTTSVLWLDISLHFPVINTHLSWGNISLTGYKNVLSFKGAFRHEHLSVVCVFWHFQKPGCLFNAWCNQ